MTDIFPALMGSKIELHKGYRSREKMASNTQILALIFGSILQVVTGYYCDNDKCKEEEFCCGENICCVSYKVWELWYFWCGILFFLFLLSLCGIFWRQRSRAHWVFRVPAPYSPLAPDEEPKYSPNRNDPYLSTKEKLGPPGSFYNPSDKQMHWYSPHPANNKMIAQQYMDSDTLYDTDSQQKVDY